MDCQAQTSHSSLCHHKSLFHQVCSCGLNEPDGHENSKPIDVCSMHCVSIVAECTVYGPFGSAFGEEA